MVGVIRSGNFVENLTLRRGRGQWGRERNWLVPAPFAFVLGRWQMAHRTGPSLWGLPDRMLHCGILVAAAARFMAEVGHEQIGSR
jgi:hypothetical protein